jgi:hypothetical protein
MWFVGVSVGLCCIFSGFGDLSWSAGLDAGATLWVRVSIYGYVGLSGGSGGFRMQVHAAWHGSIGVRLGLCCIFSGFGDLPWSSGLAVGA